MAYTSDFVGCLGGPKPLAVLESLKLVVLVKVGVCSGPLDVPNIQRFFSTVKIENFVKKVLIFFLFLLKT